MTRIAIGAKREKELLSLLSKGDNKKLDQYVDKLISNFSKFNNEFGNKADHLRLHIDNQNLFKELSNKIKSDQIFRQKFNLFSISITDLEKGKINYIEIKDNNFTTREEKTLRSDHTYHPEKSEYATLEGIDSKRSQETLSKYSEQFSRNNRGNNNLTYGRESDGSHYQSLADLTKSAQSMQKDGMSNLTNTDSNSRDSGLGGSTHNIPHKPASGRTR